MAEAEAETGVCQPGGGDERVLEETHDSVEEKLKLLRLAEELGSVTEACARTGFSRDSYYRFRKAYARGGVRALREMVRNRPRPRNRVAAEIEEAVLELRRAHPDWGAHRISRDIEHRLGLRISNSGVRSVLKRNGAALTSSAHKPPARTEGAASSRGELGGRGQRNDTATMILQEAFSLFAKTNYSTVTMKDIADAIGMNPSLIHYYFGSKEGLFLQVVEKAATDAHRTFLDICRDESDPRRVIHVWIINHAAQFTLMQNLIKISVDYANTHSRNPRIDAAIRKFYEIEARILKDALHRGIRAGLFRAVDVDRMSTFISTFLDGMLVRSVMFEEFSYDTAADDLVDFVMEHLET